jgi:glycopeptide antibiotics resistance protein
MEGVWERWGHVLLATAVALPVLLAVVTLRARAFAGIGPDDRRAWWVAAAEVGAIAGTLPWLWMILTPLPQPGAVHPVPFQEVAGYFSVSPSEAVVQVVGNLAVFAAAGALAPVRWRLGRGTASVLAVVAGSAALGSVLVETLQWALDLGRVTSVDDVLLNTAGAVLAALVTRRWWRAA